MTGAGEALQAGVVVALRAAAGLAGASVFDAPPVRAALPFLVVDEPLLTDWSAKDWDGREARLAVLIHDEGERPVRLRALAAAAERAVLALPAVLDGGWRVAGVVPVRSRVARADARRWLASGEFRVRLWRAPGDGEGE